MEVFKENRALIGIFLLWLIAGYTGPFIYVVVGVTLFLMKQRNMYMELIVGFFYILILSDSRQDSLQWAVTVKNEYIVILSLFLLMDRKHFFPVNGFYKRFIPFFLISALCLFLAPTEIIGLAAEKTLSYFLLVLVVSNYVLRVHKDHGKNFYRVLIYFATIILIIGVILIFINPYQTHLEGRFRGLFGNPNGLGIFSIMLLLVFSVAKDIYPDLFVQWEKQVVYGSIFLSILMCGSRNSLFAAFIFLFFSYFYKLSPFLGFIFFAIFIAVYQYVSANIVSIVEALGLTSYLRVETLGDASGRYIAWNFAKDQIKQNLWLGRGFEYTNYLFDEYSDWLNALGHQGNAHNSYLTLWLDTGFFGLAAYLWAFLSSFLQAARKSKLAIPVLYCVIFSTIFESWLTASLNPFTIQLFIILSMLTSEEIIPSRRPVIVPIQ
jgi:O-antigen ligase